MSQEDRKSQVPQLRPSAAKYIKYFKKKKKKKDEKTNCKNLRVDIASQHHIREGNYCAEV